MCSSILFFITDFIEDIDKRLKGFDPQGGLSKIQKGWLGVCISGIIVTNSVCWKRFERAGWGYRSHAGLSWIFRQAKILWQNLLYASVEVILQRYGVRDGVLVVDESDKKRAKHTTRIYKAHKIKDKSSGGFVNGQSIVFLVLVSPIVTIPVGFEFYNPSPELSEWNKEDERLRKKGIRKKDRPVKPERDEKYPTKQGIALNLLKDFRKHYSNIHIKCVLADALYGQDDFISAASNIFGGIQVISQLRKNQKIQVGNKEKSVNAYFSAHCGTEQKVKVRGDKEVDAIIGSGRLHTCAHRKKRFIIALKYKGEEEYRYLVASDMSWRTMDIVQAYTLRWLVEVFFQDWKSYEGWGQLTKQPDEEGSRRGLILSLLVDHCLLLHPDQLARIENKLPACTVGSLQEKIKAESLIQAVQKIVSFPNAEEMLEHLTKTVKDLFVLAPSKKHMVIQGLGHLESTYSLRHKGADCCLA